MSKVHFFSLFSLKGNHEIAGITNCEITKCGDPLYQEQTRRNNNSSWRTVKYLIETIQTLLHTIFPHIVSALEQFPHILIILYGTYFSRLYIDNLHEVLTYLPTFFGMLIFRLKTFVERGKSRYLVISTLTKI